MHEALLSQPSDEDDGAIIEVLQKGYRLGDRVLRPARVVVSQKARKREGPLRGARRPEGRLGRRDQEGLPQARPRVPPRQEPGRQGGRGALQGGAGRLRRPLRPGEAQAVRPVGSRIFGGAGGPGGGDFTWSGNVGDLGDLSDLFGGIFGGRGGGARRPVAARSRGERGRTSRYGQRLLRGLPQGPDDEDPRRPRGRLLGVPRHGSGARHLADRSARSAAAAASSPRTRASSPSRGRARAAAANGTVIEQPCRTLSRLRARAPDEALHGEDPGRSQGRHADPPQGQGRGRATSGGPPGDLIVTTRVAPRRSTSAAAPTSSSTCRSPTPRRRSAPTSRSRLPKAASRSRCRQARRTASS